MVKPNSLFYFFLFLHITLWTLAPTLIRLNLPLDSIEGATWGQHLTWGYDKNPFMSTWLTTLALKLTNKADWGIYFASQLSIAVGLWATWQLGKKILPISYALIAVLLLEGIQYYNLHAFDLSDNMLEISFWSLTILFFYQSFLKPTWKNWLLTGFFAGLCLMTKYFSIMLFISMGLFLLSTPTTRLQLKNPAFYGCILVLLLVISPHLIWLFSHQFITFHYAINRVNNSPVEWAHVIYPAEFTWQQVATFLPAVLLILPLFTYKSSPPLKPLTTFDKRFLWFMGAGPFLLTILLSILTGIKLRAAWGQPLLSLWTILLIAYLQPWLTFAYFRRFLIGFVCFLTALTIGYSRTLMRATKPSTAIYPGRLIAEEITHEWRAQYHTPLPIIAGPRWVAGNVAFYSPDHPLVYIDANNPLNSQINEEKLQQGAVFIWSAYQASLSSMPSYKTLKKRYPKLRPLKTFSFDWRTRNQLTPILVFTATLPPDGQH